MFFCMIVSYTFDLYLELVFLNLMNKLKKPNDLIKEIISLVALCFKISSF